MNLCPGFPECFAYRSCEINGGHERRRWFFRKLGLYLFFWIPLIHIWFKEIYSSQTKLHNHMIFFSITIQHRHPKHHRPPRDITIHSSDFIYSHLKGLSSRYYQYITNEPLPPSHKSQPQFHYERMAIAGRSQGGHTDNDSEVEHKHQTSMSLDALRITQQDGRR